MTDRLPASPDGIARAATMLGRGAIVAFPTDTVYGVAVVASRPDLLPALFALKRRPPDRRIMILVASLDQVPSAEWVLDERAHRLVERFWPGPLTLVLPSVDASSTQGFRAPDHPVALALIEAAGPLFATSANVSDEPDTGSADVSDEPDTGSADDVLIAFATQQDELAAVVDGGVVPGGIPSTVLDLTVSPARIVRPGPIPREQLAEAVEIEG
ncbi:MAG: threonylcarbamoyl-AMP synthase [Chloroflexi bacterium]|nr:threonylcarbamoyl-AMP synthase [Chloroflexota bacterium]